MDKSFGEFIDLIYIEGYFDKGAMNIESYPAKPFFVLNLLKGSVENPDHISFTKSAINGYIIDNSIVSVVKALKNAEYDKEQLVRYIESLYERKHKNTKTYNKRYKDKVYREALYEKVEKVYPEATIDGMSAYLADCFDKIIIDAISEESTNNLSTPKAENKDTIIASYTVNESEKKALLNICESINKQLRSLRNQTDTICTKQYELNTLSDSSNDARCKSSLEYEIASLKIRFDKSYSELEKLCSNIMIILESKERKHIGADKIYDIASRISDDEYKITNTDVFRYSSFSVMIDDFRKSIDLFLRRIDSL